MQRGFHTYLYVGVIGVGDRENNGEKIESVSGFGRFRSVALTYRFVCTRSNGLLTRSDRLKAIYGQRDKTSLCRGLWVRVRIDTRRFPVLFWFPLVLFFKGACL